MSVKLSATRHTEALQARQDQLRPNHVHKQRILIGLTAGISLLFFAIIFSLTIGSRDIPFHTVWQALFNNDMSDDARIITTLRLPRTVLGLIAGAALGVAGAVIQAVTRNPLADPGILGVNSGAAFAIALGVGFFGATSPTQYLWFAFAGALLATVIVYVIGAAGHGSVSPARITLAGVALGAVLSGITSAMRLTNDKKFSVLQTWQAGSFADRGWDIIVPTLPFIIVGIALSLGLARSLDVIALSDDMARALGTHVGRIRVLALLAITLLTGGATAMVGPIVFVGLMVPHLARWICGPRQRWITTLCLIWAPALVLFADVLGRVILRPSEIAVSIITAFIGAPVLISLARRSKAAAL